MGYASHFGDRMGYATRLGEGRAWKNIAIVVACCGYTCGILTSISWNCTPK